MLVLCLLPFCLVGVRAQGISINVPPGVELTYFTTQRHKDVIDAAFKKAPVDCDLRIVYRTGNYLKFTINYEQGLSKTPVYCFWKRNRKCLSESAVRSELATNIRNVEIIVSSCSESSFKERNLGRVINDDIKKRSIAGPSLATGSTTTTLVSTGAKTLTTGTPKLAPGSTTSAVTKLSGSKTTSKFRYVVLTKFQSYMGKGGGGSPESLRASAS